MITTKPDCCSLNTDKVITATNAIDNTTSLLDLVTVNFEKQLKQKEKEVPKFVAHIADGVSINPMAKLSGNFFINKENKTEIVYIKKVLYNNPVTVVWWSDDTITRNKCPENATYNPDSGLMFCIAKKLFGNENIAQIFNEWSLPENEEANNNYVTLKDVRKHKKELERD